jgi:hypothetical protein
VTSTGSPTTRPDLATALLQVFASQVAGGKRYDVATVGRRSANATFHTSHATDRIAGITWAMDLTPAIHDGGPSLDALCLSHLRTFEQDVSARLRRCL